MEFSLCDLCGSPKECSSELCCMLHPPKEKTWEQKNDIREGLYGPEELRPEYQREELGEGVRGRYLPPSR